jgi:hypothetical protein
MHRPRKSSSGRSLESLEARLRALPQPTVPSDLEARILSAMPALASNEMVRSARTSRRRRLAIWAGASLATAASCLLAIRFLATTADQNTARAGARNPEATESARQLTLRQPDESQRVFPSFAAQREVDETAIPTFTWPIREKSPSIASIALRPDLLD